MCEGQFGDWLRANRTKGSRQEDKAQLLVLYHQESSLNRLNREDVYKGSEVERQGLSEKQQLEKSPEEQKGSQKGDENNKEFANEQESVEGQNIEST